MGLSRDDTKGSRSSLAQAKKKCDAAKGNIKTAELPSMTPLGKLLAIKAAYDDLEEARRQLLEVAEFVSQTHKVPVPDGFYATGELSEHSESGS